jgi:hypothetical protein
VTNTQDLKNCTVAFYRQRNYATSLPINATHGATENATNDLLRLSERVLARNQGNMPRNSCATLELHGGTIQTNEMREKAELKKLIKQVGVYCKATDEEIADMNVHVLHFINTEFNGLQRALNSFRQLVCAYQQPVINREKTDDEI